MYSAFSVGHEAVDGMMDKKDSMAKDTMSKDKMSK